MDYFDGVHVFGTSSSVGPLDYKELFIRLAFSTTPSNDRYAMHVSVDMQLVHGSSTMMTIMFHPLPLAIPTTQLQPTAPRPPMCASPLSAAPPHCLCVHDMRAS